MYRFFDTLVVRQDSFYLKHRLFLLVAYLTI